MLKIPEKYTVGGQDIEIQLVEKDDNKCGSCCLASGWVKIADTFNGEKQSETSKLNTFYHELVHTILDTMGRGELSQDEVFVNTFSSFLFEAIRSFKYKEDETV